MYEFQEKQTYYQGIEHSENNIITYFENEVGHGVLQSSVQQTCHLQKFPTTKTESTHNRILVTCFFSIFAPRPNLAFKQPKLHDNFIFGMLYLLFFFSIKILFNRKLRHLFPINVIFMTLAGIWLSLYHVPETLLHK